MRLFTGVGRRDSADERQIKYIDRSVLENALFYAEHLNLPEPSAKAVAYLTEQKKKEASQYCICFLSDGTRAGDLDAGYLAGQVAAFLRFQGNTGIRIHRIQENGKNKFGDTPKTDTPWKMRCRAVLTSGENEHAGRRRKRMLSELEPGVYMEKRDNWKEELLAYTRMQYPGTYRRLNSSYKDGWIHFSEKRPVGMHSFTDAFDAGMAAAQIMSAAEVLWVELELSRRIVQNDSDYLFSVRQKACQDEILLIQERVPADEIIQKETAQKKEEPRKQAVSGRLQCVGVGMTAGV